MRFHVLPPLLLTCVACGRAGPEDTGTMSGETGDTAVRWTPLGWGPCHPILDLGGLPPYDTAFVGSPAVLGEDAWYTMKGDDGVQRIAHATIVEVPDAPGVAWTAPRLALDPSDLEGVTEVAGPHAVALGDASYALFFDAIAQSGDLDLWRCDGASGGAWTDCRTILRPDAVDERVLVGVQLPHVLRLDRGWALWFIGVDPAGARRMYTADSRDGWTWSDPRLVVDLGTLGEEDTGSIYDPAVIPDGDGYRLFYAGLADGDPLEGKRLVEAWSQDATSWEGFATSLEPGCAGEGDTHKVDGAALQEVDDGFRLYYDGADGPDQPRRIFTTTTTDAAGRLAARRTR